VPAGRAAELAALERRSLKAARAVIVTSKATADILVADFGVPARKVTAALPGTDPRPPAACAGDPPVLLTVGSLTRRKGHDVLVDALARIADLRWTSRFVGGDGYDPDWAGTLSEQVARAGLTNRIRFVGEVDDPTPEYAGADLFVLPSRYEGYGMAFAEALAHGLPVVAARAGAVPQVVPQDAGALVPPDDPAALAEALRFLLAEPAARARARAAAHRAGRALPSFDDTAATVESVLDGVLGE
jgi:glycosyltransferase involved in cell wall biosynthesis